MLMLAWPVTGCMLGGQYDALFYNNNKTIETLKQVFTAKRKRRQKFPFLGFFVSDHL